jgi:hypothetical protein
MGGIWWLASYPKSGNTWLRAIVASLVSGRGADINAMGFLGRISSDRFGFDDALGIDSADLSRELEMNLRPRAYEVWAAETERPLYCKAHDAYHLTSAGEPLFSAAATLGAVYVVRDPRAVAVSFAEYRARSIDEVIARMDDPDNAFADAVGRLPPQLRQRLLRWSDHVDSWLAAPFPVLVLRYEDLRADPIAGVTRLTAFLRLEADAGRIAAAVEATTFERLQAQEREVGFIERPRTAQAFFREGSIDGWRRVLTPEQAARIVAAHGATMQRLGYDVNLAPTRAPREAAQETA